VAVVALWIEYDGGAYVGWQRQKNGVSVQQRVEEALAEVCATPVVVYSSGRTDAGVHARGMVVHFKVDYLLPLSAYLHGVNDHLPQDIAVVDA
jgi:tRNA pseudouridine38-40 synthase